MEKKIVNVLPILNRDIKSLKNTAKYFLALRSKNVLQLICLYRVGYEGYSDV